MGTTRNEISRLRKAGDRPAGRTLPPARPPDAGQARHSEDDVLSLVRSIAIAEGFATAATIREITGWTVVIAFNAGNLTQAAKAVRTKAPPAEIVIAGDHDLTSRTGQLAAHKTAGLFDARASIPPAPGDWNDYAAEYGPEAARAALQGVSLIDGGKRLITHKDAEIALEGGKLPKNVHIAHFNNLRGLNWLSDCDCLIVIGRTRPDAKVSAHQAHVMAGTMDCPDLEKAVAWSICEAELLQGVARGRGVRRTAANPLDVFIMNDIPLELPISKTIEWDHSQPTPLDLIRARGMVIEADTSARGYWNLIAAMAPDLFETPDAARKDEERRNSLRGQTSIENIYIDKRPRKHWLYAEAKAGARGWIPVNIDPDKLLRLSAFIEIRSIRQEFEFIEIEEPYSTETLPALSEMLASLCPIFSKDFGKYREA